MDAPASRQPLILIAEDEPQIARVLEAYLRRDGFRTDWAADGESALRLHVSNRPDLVLLDVNMPKLGGFEVIRRIREHAQTPVIFVTAMTEDLERLLGLSLGADDYILKPFTPLEVVARVKAVLRRTQRTDAHPLPIRVGVLEVDAAAMLASANGRALTLTLTEFRLLKRLVQHPNRAFSKQELMTACLPDSEALERVVEVHIANLRRKLEVAGVSDSIQTVRGVGFRLRLNP
jgi:two-component system, OmpR family, response regulator AdeR